MSFLEIYDKSAGAIKSGGTTRRAAKMVALDCDHPDIETFITCKEHEEEKARILIEKGGYPADFNGEAYRTVSGQNSNNSVRVTDDFLVPAQMLAPILDGERLIGLISVHFIEGPKEWTGEHVQALKDAGVRCDVIARVESVGFGLRYGSGTDWQDLPTFERDEIARLLG